MNKISPTGRVRATTVRLQNIPNKNKEVDSVKRAFLTYPDKETFNRNTMEEVNND